MRSQVLLNVLKMFSGCSQDVLRCSQVFPGYLQRCKSEGQYNLVDLHTIQSYFIKWMRSQMFGDVLRYSQDVLKCSQMFPGICKGASWKVNTIWWSWIEAIPPHAYNLILHDEVNVMEESCMYAIFFQGIPSLCKKGKRFEKVHHRWWWRCWIIWAMENCI